MRIRYTIARKDPRKAAPAAATHAPRSHRWMGVLGAATAIAITTTAASAAGPLVRVSQASPYAGCHSPSHGATVYTNAETWPQVATNPANQDNLIGAWQQDRWTTGGNRGLVAGYSFDGGRTWNETTLPFGRCTLGGLDYERAADPWVSIGPDGTAYAVSFRSRTRSAARPQLPQSRLLTAAGTGATSGSSRPTPTARSSSTRSHR